MGKLAKLPHIFICLKSKGYSKDKRPDLKQVTLSMVMNNKLNIPIFIESLDGNSSDKKSLQETIERVEKFTSNIDLEKPFTWIADSALYNKNRLLKTNNFVWLTRIPNTLAESKKFLSTPYSSLEWQKTESDYEYTEKASNYGGVKQKWLMYYSPQKYEIDKSKFKERFSKEEELLKTLRAKYESKSYSTEAICKINETKIKESRKYHSITTEIKKSEKRYKIKIKIKVKEEVIELKKRSFGRFILGTNDVNECHYKSTSILDLYKSQQNIERGFRFLKDPYFMSDIFYLKKEERISSLLMIMTMTLLVYNYGQEKLNKNLKNTSSTLPNQKRKEKARVTLKWVFKLMSGISVLQIKQGSNKEEKMSKISDLQKKIIRMLCEKDNVYGLPTVDTS